ncbi:MAG: SGNH/GDSL hydrolase family protein [Tatlockia sp.]|jgi:phospholipase/lecithinase/hemolysin
MKALSIVFALLFSSLSLANPLKDIVVFGDSLSDNGNIYEFMGHRLPQSPPYYSGRFSNGLLWVEHLAQSYYPDNASAHLFDYAFGGAGVSFDIGDEDLFSLRREMDVYLSSHEGKADENSLFVVWIGANNYLGLPEEVEDTLTQVNAGIARDLRYLVAAGARHILVVNLPDLGTTPAAVELGSKETLSYFSKRHNALLLNTVNELKQENPDVQWIHFDANNGVKEFIKSPEKYGFTNVTESCYDTLIDKHAPNTMLSIAANVKIQEDATCEGYLFFDRVHPAAPAHRLLAEQTKAVLDTAGVEFSQE